ncbi:uncharacterized protein DS421_20g688320 [Arachis hypogaea]|nr:uncharacterized protein DS421_20g688320 [Arachis hypogaea]
MARLKGYSLVIGVEGCSLHASRPATPPAPGGAAATLELSETLSQHHAPGVLTAGCHPSLLATSAHSLRVERVLARH